MLFIAWYLRVVYLFCLKWAETVHILPFLCSPAWLLAIEDFAECGFFWSKKMVEEEWRKERGGVSVGERLNWAERKRRRWEGRQGGTSEKSRGRGGDWFPIHTGGIWLENKLLFIGLETFCSETAPADQEHGERLSQLNLRLWRSRSNGRQICREGTGVRNLEEKKEVDFNTLLMKVTAMFG